MAPTVLRELLVPGSLVLRELLVPVPNIGLAEIDLCLWLHNDKKYPFNPTVVKMKAHYCCGENWQRLIEF